ncbi:hypothetical protein JCM1841_002134 [Sporobolomyces salmonicolor]
MPPKRPSDAAPSGADKKRQRMREQRIIQVEGQPGRAGGSAGSGNNNLPPTIEVDKFAQARVFEISAMQRAMKAAKEAGTQRAFQSLPRHLRRRAASHNIRRLPLRLRERARGEVPKDAAKPKRVTRKMLGKHRQRPGLKAEMFRRRQQEKIWLETHVWHAKRMHMTEIWGHRLAEKPTEKAYRSSYRASFHGAVVHDASYYQYFELVGTFHSLEKILAKVCDPAAISPCSKRYSSGAREYTTDIYDSTLDYPRGLLGPATFIWKPLPTTTTSAPGTSASSLRTLLVRLHPALARSAAFSFENAIHKELRVGRGVKLRRLEREFVTFEITGARAAEVVKKVLRVVRGTDPATKEAWRKLRPEAGPGSVPEGMIFGFEVYDPRLSFPPKLPPVPSPSADDPADPLVPSPQIADVPTFWSEAVRIRIRQPRFRKKELDARRSHNLVPGTPLRPLAQDDRIPLLLTQRTLAPSSSSSAPMSSFTLILPSGWAMPFFSSLAYSTPRIGGLRERSLQFYEAGAPRFPEDYPGTQAFGEWEERREQSERGYWERRPPAKRPNYQKLGTKEPWRVEMEGVLERAWGEGGEEEQEEGDLTAKEQEKGKGTEKQPAASCSAQTGILPPPPAAATSSKTKEGGPYVVPLKVAKEVVSAVASRQPTSPSSSAMELDPASSSSHNPAQSLQHSLFAAWRSRSEMKENDAHHLLRDAMVRVRLTPYGRGVPEDLGLVYELEDEQMGEVRAKLAGRRKGKGRASASATGEGEGAEDLCDRPSAEKVIGRLTTGTFSLARGEGFGIGVVSFYRYLRMVERDQGAPKDLRNLVLFRNRDGEVSRAGTLELM